jgi:hypothetical protein
VNLSIRTRRLAAAIVATVSIVAPLLAPAAEAAPPPANPCLGSVTINCLPDLYLSSMYQRDASGNSIWAAAPGQTVVYPIVVGNQSFMSAARNVQVWWQADTTGFSNQGWVFQSFTADSGFFCHDPGDNFTGEQVYCEGGTIGAGQVAHITITMRAPTVAGTHHIGIKLDPNNLIGESNESNNQACCLTLAI